MTAAYGDIQAVDLFQGNAPRLRRLHLSAVVLRDWHSPIVKSLSSLTLQYYETGAPSLQEVIEILRACGQLEKLKLTSIRFQDHNLPVTTVTVPLHQLRVLDIYRLQPDTVILILLRVIETPNCITFELNCDDSPMRSPELVVFLFPMITSVVTSAFEAALSSSDALTMRLQAPGTISLILKSDDQRRLDFALHLHNTVVPSEVLDWVLALLTQRRLPTHIVLSRLLIPLPDTLAFLWQLPHTNSLRFDHWEGSAIDAVLQELSSVSNKDGGWLCPRLGKVAFQYCETCDARRLLRMIRCRPNVQAK